MEGEIVYVDRESHEQYRKLMRELRDSSGPGFWEDGTPGGPFNVHPDRAKEIFKLLNFEDSDEEKPAFEHLFGPLPEEEKPELWHKLCVVALDDYCQRQAAEFEVAGRHLRAKYFFLECCYFHLSFEAKPKGIQQADAPWKQFFAEVCRFKDGSTQVKFCDIMDPSNPDLVKGCRYCSHRVLHPNCLESFCYPHPKL